MNSRLANVCVFVFKDHVANYISQDPRVDQEIIDSIDQAYFNDDQTFDIVEYNLNVSSCHLHAILAFTLNLQIFTDFHIVKCELFTSLFSCANAGLLRSFANRIICLWSSVVKRYQEALFGTRNCDGSPKQAAFISKKWGIFLMLDISVF